MGIVQKSWELLFPNKELPFDVELKYSGRFKGYNANVELYQNILTFKLSKQWRYVSQDIKVGLVQELLLKLFKKKYKAKYQTTLNIEMYHHFLKSVHLAIPKTQTDPILEDAFHRINARYLYGLLERPNLRWGKESTTLLGTYDYGTDTVTISRILHPDTIAITNQDLTEEEVLDSILYHELLHKKFKFNASGSGRTCSHTKEFREWERKFKNYHEIEKELKKLCSRQKRRSWWF